MPPPGTIGGTSVGAMVPGPYVWDAATARKIPGVGRALAIYGGMLKQAPLDAWRGIEPLPRPRLLDAPDPTPSNPRSWFVQVSVEDYLLNGNAVAVVTARNAEGWPAACAWIPAQWVTVTWQPGSAPQYWIGSQQVPLDDVVHVKRGADRWYPARGVGAVEEYLSTLDRIRMQEEYERSALAEGAVPSVAVISPNPDLSPDEADDAKITWMEKYSGGKREPAILPNGTQVIPLGWSPSDNQMTEARKLSLTDLANAFNLDGYWLGAPAASLTYRSPGPMYLNLLRTSINPVAVDFEAVWSASWLPRGQSLRFDRAELLRDDLATTVHTMVEASGGPVMSTGEARAYMSLPVNGGPVGDSAASPVDTVDDNGPGGDAGQDGEDAA